jgi:hypothetical protein
MAVAVGIDVAKEFGRAAIVLAETGKTLVSRRVDNDPDSIEELIEYLHQADAQHAGGSPGRLRRGPLGSQPRRSPTQCLRGPCRFPSAGDGRSAAVTRSLTGGR